MRLAELLDPGPVHVPPVLTPECVGGLAAWQDLVRRGALTFLREPALGTATAAVPAGTRIAPVHRAHTVATLTGGAVPRRAVVAGVSAAWVHTGLYDGVPAPHLPMDAGPEFAHDAGAHRPDVPAGAVLRCAVSLHRDTTYLGAVPVTSPVRTAADVACRLPFEHAVAVLVALAAGSRDTAPVDPDAVERVLESRRRVVGRPAARRALAAARAATRR